MIICVDTCVLPRCQLEEGRLYRDAFGKELGFELLPMFDLPAFEADLKKNLALFAEGPLFFHEPVWGVEHTAEKGSPAWEESMFHLRLTQKYARILRPEKMVFHLNNGPVDPARKALLLRNSLENLEEMRTLFPDTEMLVENTGIRSEGTQLLNQAEFTGLCRERGFGVLIDVGHANANGWDLCALIHDLRGQIGGFHLHNNDGVRDLHHRLRDGTIDFQKLVCRIKQDAPDVPCVMEYTQPDHHGAPLLDDIRYLLTLFAAGC